MSSRHGRPARARALRSIGVIGSLAIALLLLVPTLGPVASAQVPAVASPRAAVSTGASCDVTGCDVGRGEAALLTIPPSPSASPASGTVQVANYSSATLLVSDLAVPGLVLGFGTSEFDGVGSNATATGIYPFGTVAEYRSENSGHSWTATTLTNFAGYVNSTSSVCGFGSLGAVGAAASAGTVAILVTAAPVTNGMSCVVAPTGWALLLFVSTDGGLHWPDQQIISFQPSAPSSVPAQRPADVAVSPDGSTIYVAYPDAVNDTLDLSTWALSNETLSAPTALLNTSAAGVRLAASDSGGLGALVWYTSQPGTPSNHFEAGYAVDYLALAPPSWSPINTTVGAFTLSSLSGFPSADLVRDVSSASPFEGHLYALWTNGSGVSGGDSAVVLSRSIDGGATWVSSGNVSGSASAVTCCAGAATDNNGTLVISWYGLTTPPGPLYRVTTAASFDGGLTASPEFGLGGWTGNGTNALVAPAAVGTGDSVLLLWTQFRSATSTPCASCPGGNAADDEVDASVIDVLAIASTDATTIAVSGLPTAGSTVAIGPSAVLAAGIEGQPFSLTAPASFVVGTTTRYFAEWFGSNYSTSPAFRSTWSPAGSLTACFVAAQGDPCQAPGAPGTLSVGVSPPTATIVASGLLVTLHSGHGTILLPPGPAYVVASAPGYASNATTVQITPGNTTVLSISLLPLDGLLEGNVTPTTARVTVDGGGIPVAQDGSFSISLAPGSHSVEAVAYSYFTYSTSVLITYGTPTFLQINLTWNPAHLEGSVFPSNASFWIDGSPVPLGTGGSFAVTLSGGGHSLRATAWSYLPYSGQVNLEPSQYVPIGIRMTPANGTLVVSVEPSNASVLLDGVPISSVGGYVEVPVPWGDHQVSASAWRYSPETIVVPVPYNNSTLALLSLTVAPAWIVGSVTPVNATLTLDGTALPVAPNGTFNRTVEAGAQSEHPLVASAPGFVNTSIEVQVVPGQPSEVQLHLVPIGSSSTSERPLTLATLSDGLALDAAVLLGIGVVFLLARRRR